MVGVIALALVTVIAVERDVFSQGLEGAPQLLVFLLLVRQLVPRASSINRRYGALMNHTPSLRRVRAALDIDPNSFESGGTQCPAPLVTGRIRFDNVSLSYPGRPDVLRDVKLEIPKGQTVAVVGESGSGKTSLVSLLPRYYDVSSGAIYFDDTDISEIDLKHLRDRIGVVSQDVFLFNTTIRDNILMGREDASPDEVENAARAARAHGFISQLPNGYDTLVGERGVTLSGGQRQRVSIAQVFLRNPEIIVLDEATNALDTESEAFVQQSIDELMKGRTVFVVAHRLNTIRGADVIIVLREGEVVEMGDWAELSQAGGAFQSLLALQALTTERPTE
jgi:ABC-type multidrug transport system fused ATPase/permease subunit